MASLEAARFIEETRDDEPAMSSTRNEAEHDYVLTEALSSLPACYETCSPAGSSQVSPKPYDGMTSSSQATQWNRHTHSS
jgi:hypothetical protein